MKTGLLSIKDWVEGMKSPGGALATRSESKAEAAGHALVGVVEGGLVGLATGVASSLLPGGLTSQQMGIGALAVGALATVVPPKFSRHVANASVGLAAIAMHEHSGAKAAHHAGTASSVLTNKAKAIAAHGEDSVGFGLDAGSDPLIEEGARVFRS